MIYILFNPLANNSRGEEDARRFANNNIKEEVKFVSVIGLDFVKFFEPLTKKDKVVLCGGDGTVNRFANDTYGMKFNCELYYAKCGSGNDFYRDVVQYEENGMVEFTQFISKLPLVTVNGIKRRFINGIGYGIDGDTCLVGDEIREKDPNAVINYTNIAIGLLLKKDGFQTKQATVEVDGKKYEFDNVWLSSAMYGKFYGGGMMAAPKQDRLHNNNTCTVTTLSSKGRLITFLRFPGFSGGKHEGKKHIVELVGKKIKVTFDKPCALQIDGDTVKDVTTYTVEF